MTPRGAPTKRTAGDTFAHPASGGKTRLLERPPPETSPAGRPKGGSFFKGGATGDPGEGGHHIDSSFLPDILSAGGSDQGAPVNKNIIATPLKIGFLGIGIMGSGMVENLLKHGHEVTIWVSQGVEEPCGDYFLQLK